MGGLQQNVEIDIGRSSGDWRSLCENLELYAERRDFELGGAEFAAAVEMSTESMGLMQMAEDRGMRMEGRMLTDSSAA